MTMRSFNRFAVAALMAAGLPTAAFAQTGQATPDARPSTSVSLELSAREGYDDGFNGGSQGSSFFEFSPLFEVDRSGRRNSFSLSYRPTLRRFAKFTDRNRLDHQLGFKTNVWLSQNWRFDFRQSALYVTNPFLLVIDETAGDSTLGDVAFGPNDGSVGLDQRAFHSRSSATLNYQWGRSNSFSFGADYFVEEHDNARLVDRNSLNYRAGYRRTFSRGKAFGVSASRQRFRLSEADTEVQTDSVLLTYEHTFRTGTTLTVFGGPQFSELDATPIVTINFFFFIIDLPLPVHESTTGASYGGLFRHRINDRTWTQASFSRRVAEGGSFSGTTVQESLRGGLRRNLGKRVELDFGASFTTNKALGQIGPDGELRTAGASTAFRFKMNRRASLDLNYNYIYYNSVPDELRGLASRHRVWAGVAYRLGTLPPER